MALLEVQSLSTTFKTRRGLTHAVSDPSFDIQHGETVAIVGESGCGKSTTSMSIMKLFKKHVGLLEGSIRFEGKDLVKASEREMRAIRGNQISMIFQEPMTSLNPVLTVGWQLAECLRLHQNMTRDAARKRGVELLKLVGLSEPEQRMRQHPYQLSGGMRQRVMIAIALACNPRLLIADEPTTALDVTIQAQILDLLRDMKARIGAAILLITHDLGVVAQMAERVIVMYAGRKVEEANVRDIFANPLHPYTVGLLQAVPRLGASDDLSRRLADIPGQPPDLRHPSTGCPFSERCPHAMAICRSVLPPLSHKGDGHLVACHLAASIQ